MFVGLKSHAFIFVDDFHFFMEGNFLVWIVFDLTRLLCLKTK